MQRELGGNDYLRQASYSCAHRCAPPPRKQTSLSERVQSGDQWEMEPALVGPEVPTGRLLGVTLANHLPDGSELVPGASPWLFSPDPWSLSSRWLAEGWGLGGEGQ